MEQPTHTYLAYDLYSVYDLLIEVSVDVDLNTEFEARCVDTGELLVVQGWNYTFELQC